MMPDVLLGSLLKIFYSLYEPVQTLHRFQLHGKKCLGQLLRKMQQLAPDLLVALLLNYRGLLGSCRFLRTILFSVLSYLCFLSHTIDTSPPLRGGD